MAIQLPPIKCGHCGALVRAKGGAKVAVCRHCGASIAVPDSFAGLLPGQAVGAVVAPPPPASERRRVRARRRVLGVAGVVVVLGVVGGVVAFQRVERERAAAAERELHWLTAGRAPVPVVVPDTGSGGLLLGYVRRGSGKSTATLAAFDQRTLALRWESSPVDHAAIRDLAGADVVDAHKGHAVAATGNGRLEIIELGSGKSVKSVELGAPVTAVNAPPDSAACVFVALANHTTVKVSVPDGAVERVERPDFLDKGGPPPAPGSCWPGLGVYDCVAARELPELERHQARFGMRLGDTLFVVARPMEGAKPDPTRDAVLAFDPGAERPRWTENLEGTLVSELLSPDLFYLVLRAPSGLRLRALKLDTGFKAFDEALPRPNEITAKRPLLDQDRLYLPRADWVDVIDARSGAPIGTLGAP